MKRWKKKAEDKVPPLGIKDVCQGRTVPECGIVAVLIMNQACFLFSEKKSNASGKGVG